ncbi:IRK-interacting protein-like isoform X2 [Phalaenopsis equestris]|uniref:IRK-interacting protein-like isoform X2 n=1 Tax=Phalaenopsis equestris TaxID=78828 RepID=UPI0009E49532|nr:IRK-interacting protein-like isoform X2 [Phalaenopsis equestris]
MASSAAHLQIDGMQRKEVQVAMAKAVELRAIHAALLQGSGSSPAAMRVPAGSSPLSRLSNNAADDYPVFTPTYEDKPLPGYQFIRPDRSLSECWSEIRLEGEPRDNENVLSDTNSVKNKFSSLKDDQLAFLTNEHLSNKSFCINHQNPIMQTAPEVDVYKSLSRRSAIGELKSVTFNTTSNLATISMEVDAEQNNLKSVNNVTPSVDTRTPLPPQSKSRGTTFSWLFHKTKKKNKLEMSPNANESENMRQILTDWGTFSLETLKRELFEANERKDAALAEVAKTRASLGELQQKLETLESYCEELRRSLKQAVHEQGKQVLNTLKRTKPININHSCNENSMPVSHEVMVEGFLQVVSEARLSVKHFCKALIDNIDKTDSSLLEKLSMLVHPNPLTLDKKYPKADLYHLQALINQSLHQDFENCVFQKNGSPKLLDPHQDCLENFSSFVSLRNLSWNEVLRKGTKYYSDDFSYFCDQKMSSIVSILNWSRPWPELLLQSFFIAAKCMWLLHLLAFSFNPPLLILRVGENRSFDPLYMEDVLKGRQQRTHSLVQVKIMVMPGFYVHDKVLKCRVLCSYG